MAVWLAILDRHPLLGPMRAVVLELPSAVRVGLTLAIAWAAVAFAFALQGYCIALYKGLPQPWWPSFGYALAIFSVWAVITPLIVIGTRRACRLVPTYASQRSHWASRSPNRSTSVSSRWRSGLSTTTAAASRRAARWPSA